MINGYLLMFSFSPPNTQLSSIKKARACTVHYLIIPCNWSGSSHEIPWMSKFRWSPSPPLSSNMRASRVQEFHRAVPDRSSKWRERAESDEGIKGRQLRYLWRESVTSFIVQSQQGRGRDICDLYLHIRDECYFARSQKLNKSANIYGITVLQDTSVSSECLDMAEPTANRCRFLIWIPIW